MDCILRGFRSLFLRGHDDLGSCRRTKHTTTTKPLAASENHSHAMVSMANPTTTISLSVIAGPQRGSGENEQTTNNEVELPSRIHLSSTLDGCNYGPPSSVVVEPPKQHAIVVYYPPRLIPEETQGSPLSRQALLSGGDSPVIRLMQEVQLVDAHCRSASS